MSYKFGIVCMTKNPLDFENWLLHHVIHFGVYHFYICVEDTPSLQTLLLSDKWKNIVTATFSTGERDYISQMDRQISHIKNSSEKAIEHGCTHLIHIDDDELLYAHDGIQKLNEFLGNHSDMDWYKIQNYEAVYEAEDCTHPFLSTKMFLKNVRQFTAYMNGKPMANLSKKVKVKGVHSFGGNMENIPENILLVLHYESPCKQRWREKFKMYSIRNANECKNGTIPFEFYCSSIESQKDEVWEKYKLYDGKKEIVRLTPFCSKDKWPSYGRTILLQ